MRKIKRNRNQRRVIILRGIKYLLIISALLLALAFVLTTFVFKGNDEEEAVTETTTEIIGRDEPEEEEEDENTDNKRAMFLVNIYFKHIGMTPEAKSRSGLMPFCFFTAKNDLIPLYCGETEKK